MQKPASLRGRPGDLQKLDVSVRFNVHTLAAVLAWSTPKGRGVLEDSRAAKEQEKEEAEDDDDDDDDEPEDFMIIPEGPYRSSGVVDVHACHRTEFQRLEPRPLCQAQSIVFCGP